MRNFAANLEILHKSPLGLVKTLSSLSIVSISEVKACLSETLGGEQGSRDMDAISQFNGF